MLFHLSCDVQGADDPQDMDVDKQAQLTEQREPLAEIGQDDNPDARNTAGTAAVQHAPEADEPVSDTDNDEGESCDRGLPTGILNS